MSEFTEAVESSLAGLEYVSTGPCRDCPECHNSHGDLQPDEEMLDEGGFSWSQCDACGSRLGGNRYDAHGVIKAGTGKPLDGKPWPESDKLLHLSVCEDCLCYLANGDEPEHWE